MEALPFHYHEGDENNGDDNRRKAKNSNEIKEQIFDYSPVKVDCLWFEEKIPVNSEEELTVTKFKAHFAYKRQDYIKAISLYNRCYELLPANANLLLREVGESQARCLLKVGRYKDCEQLLTSLLGEKGNPQDSSLRSLLSDVYIALGRLEDAAANLKQCLTLHPEYTQYWIKVSDVFEHLAQSSSYFLEHVINESDKEHEMLSEIWYFVDSLKKSFLIEDFPEGNEMGRSEHGLNASDYKGHGWLGLLQRKVHEKACKDAVQSVLEKWNDSSVRQTVNIENSYDRECKCFQTGLAPSALAYSDRDDRGFPCANGSVLLNESLPEGTSSQGHKSIAFHFMSWYCVMTMAHWFALGKTWQSLGKTIQYSKGFAKRIEQKMLAKIEERILTSTGCEKITNWLKKFPCQDSRSQNLGHL